MKTKYLSQLLSLMMCVSFLSCKKKNPQPTVSDSMYNNAYMEIGKHKGIYRNGTGIDSTHNFFIIDAGFGDSSDLHTFHEKVGSISINGLAFGSPSAYHYENLYATDSEMTLFNSAKWKVISSNGVTDLEYDAGSMAYYQDTLPYVINRNLGFSVKINTALAPNADSVRIVIDAQLEKVVSVSADSVYFSPTELSVLSASNNWSDNVLISCIRHYTTSANGRGYKISSYREVFYNINVN